MDLILLFCAHGKNHSSRCRHGGSALKILQPVGRPTSEITSSHLEAEAQTFSPECPWLGLGFGI